MKETITLNSKEQQRLMVLNRVLEGQLTAAHAGELLVLSVRQIRRRVAYRKEGAAGLADVLDSKTILSRSETLPTSRQANRFSSARSRSYSGRT